MKTQTNMNLRIISNGNHKFILCAILFFITGCSPQLLSSHCNSNLKVQFDKATRNDRKSNAIEDTRSEAFIVKFMNDFSDSIQVFVNDSLEFEDFVLSDRVSGVSDKFFGYDYSTVSGKVMIKIVSKTRNSCFAVEIRRKYPIVYVFILDPDNWIVRFSNVHYIN